MMVLYDEFMKINEEAKKEYEQNRAEKENEAMRNGNFSFDSGADNGKKRIDAAWDSILQRNAEKYSEALDALGKGPGEEVHFSDSESTESNGSKKD